MKQSYKVLVLLSLVGLMTCPVLAKKTVQENLAAAVSEADFAKVKKYLRKLDRQKLSAQERKNALNHVLGVSNDNLEMQKSTAGFLNNRCDIARCVGGALVAVYAFSRIIPAYKSACVRCGAIECGDSCTCVGCTRKDGEHQDRCRDKKHFTKGPESYTKIGYGIRRMPHHLGLAAFGLYQFYQGLTGATQKSVKASSESINEFLKGKVSELES